MMDPRELADFAQALLPSSTARDPGTLGPALAACVTEATEAYPGVGRDPLVEPDGFLSHLFARLDTGAAIAPQLARTNTRDLYLAWAALAGDAGALETFERVCMPAVQAALARMEGEGSLAEDVAQELRDKLLVGTGPAPAKLAEYRGRGELKSWVRVAAVRQALNWRRRTQRERAPGDEQLEALAAPTDPEIAFLKGHYQQAFKSAFHAALAALTPEERNLLRSRLLDGLSIDELALLHGIHRSTAARRVEQVRQRLQSMTRRLLQERLKISAQEFASIARLVMSRFDASIRRVLTESDD